MSKKESYFEYFTRSLSGILDEYVRSNLKKHDWEILAVDVSKDVVVFKRWESGDKE